MPTRLLIGSEVLDPDVTISEQFTSSAVVTSHPVEGAAAVADHVQEQPLSISLQLVITQNPLRVPAFGSEGVTQSPGPVYTLTGSLADRARQLVARLKATRTAGELLTLESAREGTIQNLALANVTHSYTLAKSATVSLLLTQIEVADARTVAIPPTLQARGKKKRNKGKQPTKAASETKRKSLAAKLADSF